MMRCPRCAEENPDAATFCIVCGVKLGTTTNMPLHATTAQRVYPNAPSDRRTQMGQGTATFALIVGIVSGSLMLLGLILVGVGAGIASSTLGAFGVLSAFLAIAINGIAFVAALVALIRYQPPAGSATRRHALIGIALGTTSLLLCCVIGYLATLLPPST